MDLFDLTSFFAWTFLNFCPSVCSSSTIVPTLRQGPKGPEDMGMEVRKNSFISKTNDVSTSLLF